MSSTKPGGQNLFEPLQLGTLQLQNRIVMSPMTRSRAIDYLPNDLMAEYYGMRAEAGLIITEGVAPSPNGLGYPRIPGAFSREQVEGWKKTAAAVHRRGGKIFMQLMHTGRVSHPANMLADAEIVAPSPIAVDGEMYTDAEGMQPYPAPREMSAADIVATQEEFVQAARNAIEAGFDGVELHGANGYLIDQFINPASNRRTDAYGGSIENRARFALEVSRKVAEAIGSGRTGIRLSPYGRSNDMDVFDDIDETYAFLASKLASLDLVYIHIADMESMGAPAVPIAIKERMKREFGGPIILSGGYDRMRAERDLAAGKGDLFAFGRAFLANPDLVSRLERNLPLNEPKSKFFFTPGPEGYLDYPLFGERETARVA